MGGLLGGVSDLLFGSAPTVDRQITAEEKALQEQQSQALGKLFDIAGEQYNLAQDELDYYKKTFAEGSETEAKTALAKLQSRITGKEISPEDVQGMDATTLLRDTILNATPAFQEQANEYIKTTTSLAEKFGTDVTEATKTLTADLTKQTQDYQAKLTELGSQAGTINKDILSREQGASQAGISSAYAEARKQLQANLAQRGLNSSGIEANILASQFQQEAMAKAQGSYNARQSALQQSEALRQQQYGLLTQGYNVGTANATNIANANLQGIQSVYGVLGQNALQAYNTQQQATQQGITALSQIYTMGQQEYSNALAQQQAVAQAYANAGGVASSGLAQAQNLSATIAQQNAQLASAQQAGMGQLLGAGIGAYASLK